MAPFWSLTPTAFRFYCHACSVVASLDFPSIVRVPLDSAPSGFEATAWLLVTSGSCPVSSLTAAAV
jgi:hypothetical protein